jgi:hypothetical protein
LSLRSPPAIVISRVSVTCPSTVSWRVSTPSMSPMFETVAVTVTGVPSAMLAGFGLTET